MIRIASRIGDRYQLRSTSGPAEADQLAGELMTSKAFATVITETSDSLAGPWRRPHQMLNAQVYDSHASIHDDATAQKLGFQGGTIEGPTHFSQFAPLCLSLWGNAWFETGCISAHYRNPSFDGEEVQALLAKPEPGERQCKIQMVKSDGTEVLRGTASVGHDASLTALDQRLTELKPLEHFPLSVQHTRRCGSSWRIRLAGRHRVGVRCGTRGPRPIAQQLFGARL